MEDKFSENRTRKQKEKKAGEAEEQAVTDRAVDGSCDRAVLMQRLGFRDRGQQHNGNGAGERRGEQDERK